MLACCMLAQSGFKLAVSKVTEDELPRDGPRDHLCANVPLLRLTCTGRRYGRIGLRRLYVFVSCFMLLSFSWRIKVVHGLQVATSAESSKP